MMPFQFYSTAVITEISATPISSFDTHRRLRILNPRLVERIYSVVPGLHTILEATNVPCKHQERKAVETTDLGRFGESGASQITHLTYVTPSQNTHQFPKKLSLTDFPPVNMLLVL
jgi:hypothetical protein